MLLTDVSQYFQLQLPPADPAAPRSPGVHISDLVSAAAIDRGLFEPDDTESALTKPNPAQRQFPQPVVNRMCAGLAWEEWLSRQYAGRMVFHPGEVWVDGVAGTPDALQMEGGSVYVHEFKFTWKSINNPPHKYWYWLAQIQAYMLGLGAHGAFLHTYHVNGDYRGSGPIYRVMYLQFTLNELQENWQELVQYKPQIEAKLKTTTQTGAVR